jgi:hypothetical protein
MRKAARSGLKVKVRRHIQAVTVVWPEFFEGAVSRYEKPAMTPCTQFPTKAAVFPWHPSSSERRLFPVYRPYYVRSLGCGSFKKTTKVTLLMVVKQQILTGKGTAWKSDFARCSWPTIPNHTRLNHTRLLTFALTQPHCACELFNITRARET